MELQEDAYRINQVLETVQFNDIIKFFRTQVPLKDTAIRCELALKHFFSLEEESAKSNNEAYEIEMKADFLCIRHLLKSVTDEEIKEMLNVLGPVSNRKQIAIKMLLHNQSSPHRKKRKKYANEIDKCEATSSKLLKFADSNDTPQLNMNGNENLADESKIDVPALTESLKLTIKSLKDSNGNNKFMIASSHSKNKLNNFIKEEPSEVDAISTTTPETDIMDQAEIQSVIMPPFVSKIPNITSVDSSTNDVMYTVPPSTSNNYHNDAGPLFANLDEPVPQPRTRPPTPASLEPVSPQRLRSSTPGSLKPVPPPARSRPPTPGNDTKMPFTYFSIANVPLPSTSGATITEVVDLDETLDLTIKNGIDLSVDSKLVDEKLVLKLIEMFPAADPKYIRQRCEGKIWSEQNFDEIVTVILSDEEHPKRPERQPSPPKEVDPEEQFMWLKGLLPEADPNYLHEKLDQFAGDPDGLSQFVEEAWSTQKYPTLKEYQRKQQLSAQQRQYTTEFKVERFVELFPDPVAIFEDPKRKTTILDASDKCYVKWFMRNKFNQLYAKHVNTIVDTKGDQNIMAIVKALNLSVVQGFVKKTRYVSHSRPDTQNIPLLQELAYFEHIEEIRNHLENKKKQAALERANAKELGLLQSCSCCYDEEVMPDDILTCTGGCRFCRDCIKRGTEVAFGEGKLNFPCLMDCGAEFSLQVLQHVLPPKVFSKIAQKKAVAEVKAAGIEELEACPFCDFATIPAPEDKLFRCLNPDCMKESCRLCKEPSHVPLRCEEVEKDEAVKARTYIENKMTEALIRECWKCNAKFIKEEGCNKMTCSCGAIMCYVCRKPVKDYKHFNGQGGDRFDLCPLYTDNFVVNEKNVLKAAEEAKKAVDPNQLKNDPTADLQKHFGNKIKEAERRAKHRHHVHVAPPVGLPAAARRLNEVARLRQELRVNIEQIRQFHDEIRMPERGNNADVVAAFEQRYYIPGDQREGNIHIRDRQQLVIPRYHHQPPPAVPIPQTFRPPAPIRRNRPETPPDFNEVWDLYQQMEAQHGGEPGNEAAREVEPLVRLEDLE